MRGIWYFLAIAGIAAAQDNKTYSTGTPSPLTTEEAVFSILGGGGGQCKPTTTVTRWSDKPITVTVEKPGSKETITSTCYETTTVHDTKTQTSTTTCTVVSCFLSASSNLFPSGCTCLQICFGNRDAERLPARHYAFQKRPKMPCFWMVSPSCLSRCRPMQKAKLTIAPDHNKARHQYHHN